MPLQQPPDIGGGLAVTPQPLILAVDDDVGILRLLKATLTSVGFDLITATSAA